MLDKGSGSGLPSGPTATKVDGEDLEEDIKEWKRKRRAQDSDDCSPVTELAVVAAISHWLF